jgi:protoporphyrinogen oxidase
MPLKDLAKALGPSALPAEAAKVADGLLYRDFRVVGLLVKRMKIRNATALKTLDGLIPDTWIYVQEPHVKLGRLQVFNNWSPYMPRDFRGSVWLGLEYFCSEGDGLWSMSDEEMGSFAAAELASIGFVERDAVLDAVSVKAPKAYPAYFGSYSGMKSLQDALDAIPNLYPVGRNGTHRYNNMDHSMLSGLAAEACVVSGAGDKRRVWEINAEPEYQEGEAP